MPTEKPNVKKIPANPLAKPQVKQPNMGPTRSYKEEFLLMFEEGKAYVTDWLRQWTKAKDIVKNNFELGKRHLALGNLNDAKLRFKFVLWLEPTHVNAWYYLGATLMAKGDKKAAAGAFRKSLELKPGNEEALYLLTVANGKVSSREGMPKRMPIVLAREYFDSIAVTYTEDQLYAKYEGHTELCNAVRSFLLPGRLDHVILELGVGTGFCGPLIRDVASHLTGVDISAEMLAEAIKVQNDNGEKIYDAMVKRELSEFLKDAPEKAYDIVMAANVFGYLGDLEQVFTESARVLKEKGIFAFTADAFDGDGYQFDPQETKFRYSRMYLQELAKAHGLKELKCKEAAIYPDYTAWICVFQK